MVAYLKAGPQVTTYSDYLRATQQAEKEDFMELPWGPRSQATDTPPKPRATSFFPLRKLKGNQGGLVDAGDDEDQESDDPRRTKGVMEEFMVCLARAIKDSQADKKC